MISRTWRSTLQRVALALGASCITGEAAVRIAANFLPGVQYLATVRLKPRQQHFATLESFLKAQPHLVPYRKRLNYYNNSLGFNDVEFEVPKPPGRYRIVSLGDSFCFSMVPYPDTVQTLVEKHLVERCGHDLELLNAGIGATGIWEYHTLLELMLPVWRPDAVVLHLYLGNDGPDLFKHQSEMPFQEGPVFHSSFLTYFRNAVKVLRSLEAPPSAPIAPRRGGRNRAGEKGGEVVDPTLPPATDQDPAIAGPLYSVEAFRMIMADEFGRFYVPKEGVDPDWQPILRILEEMRWSVERAGVRFLVVLYPSQLQIYPDFRKEMLAAVTALREFQSLAEDRIDPMAPNRVLLDWCVRTGAGCLDLTPYLSKKAQQESRPLYSERDTHWNILGNRLAAAGEAVFLKQEICSRNDSKLAPRPQ